MPKKTMQTQDPLAVLPPSPMLDKWSGLERRGTEPPERVPIPVHVLIEEALEVARFFQAYYAPEIDARGRVLRPGLEQAHHGGQFRRELGQEIVELQEAVQAAHVRQLFLRPVREVPWERAELVLSELQAGIGYLLDDGVLDVNDRMLAALKKDARRSRSASALGVTLRGHASFAQMHREALGAIGAFDVGLIDEALALSNELPLQVTKGRIGSRDDQHEKFLQLRNRLAATLYERMQVVRSAARFVFRNDRALIRKVTSSYLRDRVARYRQKQKAKQKAV